MPLNEIILDLDCTFKVLDFPATFGEITSSPEVSPSILFSFCFCLSREWGPLQLQVPSPSVQLPRRYSIDSAPHFFWQADLSLHCHHSLSRVVGYWLLHWIPSTLSVLQHKLKDLIKGEKNLQTNWVFLICW